MWPRSTAELVQEVQRTLDKQDFNRALNCIKYAVNRAVQVSFRRNLLNFGSPAIDILCLSVGARIFGALGGQLAPASHLQNPQSYLDVYVASELYHHGGHTALIGDFVRSSPTRRALLLVTDIQNRFSEVPEAILTRIALPRSSVILCPEKYLAGKVVWLRQWLAQLSPNRIFLFHHPYDCVAVAACQLQSSTAHIFVHHSDRLPSVGAFLPHSVHVDLTPFCYCCCRNKAGIANNIFVPLVAEDRGSRNFVKQRLNFDRLITASAGSAYKYRRDHEPSYPSMVVEILRLTNGHHVHIGSLAPSDLDYLRSALNKGGVAPTKLVHIPHVSSIWDAMADFDIDLFVNSFPVRGARTSVEVMGSGTPAIWHVSSEQTFFHDTHMKYPEAATWRTKDDLLAVIRKIDGGWLERQSRAARRYYEANHRPDLMAEQLSRGELLSRAPPTVPPRWEEPRLVSFDDLLSVVDR